MENRPGQNFQTYFWYNDQVQIVYLSVLENYCSNLFESKMISSIVNQQNHSPTLNMVDRGMKRIDIKGLLHEETREFLLLYCYEWLKITKLFTRWLNSLFKITETFREKGEDKNLELEI